MYNIYHPVDTTKPFDSLAIAATVENEEDWSQYGLNTTVELIITGGSTIVFDNRSPVIEETTP
jgi:hypothetical protein